jgi:signal transduction histidine kinase
MVGVHAELGPADRRGWFLPFVARVLRGIRSSWVDIAWVAFVGLNLLAMQLVLEWQTVPFLIIWITLTAVYGFRLWRLGSTILAVAVVTVATGGLIGWQVVRGQEEAEYLAEVPLLAVMFVVMAWHARRRQSAMEEMRRVFEQQRRFLQDASHGLRTPITVALGHTELIERTATDPTIADDARVAINELLRLRQLSNRLLLLASAQRPDFLHLAPMELCDIALDALKRWSHTPRAWSLGPVDDAIVQGDRDQLTLAVDALIENAVEHTDPEGRIELSACLDHGSVVLAIADSGPGIPAAEVERIFDRFSRVDAHRSRDGGGFGLGLAIVKAIAEAHHGSVRVSSEPDHGARFELRLPEYTARVGTSQPAQSAISEARMRAHRSIERRT